MVRERTKDIMQNRSYFFSLINLSVESVELHMILTLGSKSKGVFILNCCIMQFKQFFWKNPSII